MKTRITLLLVLLLALTGLAVVKAQDDVFKVAAVAPSATNDLAFSQSMYDALVAIQEEMGEENFEFVFQDGTFVVDDAAVALREWAASGEYDLVIAHGSQFGSVVEELAAEFPEVSFAWGTDKNTFGLPNVFAYTAAAEEGGYINGLLASGLTQTKVIGVIGPIEVGDAKLYVDGFKAGVASIDPEIQVLVNYIQSFSDVPLATEAANTFVASNADVLTGSAQMVVGPIGVATENNLFWLGTQSSQAELAGDSGILFQVYRWDVVLADMIEKIQSGTLGGESYTIDLENGGLEMQISEFNTKLTDEDKAQLQEALDAAIEAIVNGDIVPLPELEPEATPEATEAAGS